jgi:hypothetical protein
VCGTWTLCLHSAGVVCQPCGRGLPVRSLFCLLKARDLVLVSRRENQLKLSHDWLCYLAPEIVREMTPGKDEDQLPFSKAADVYAFG